MSAKKTQRKHTPKPWKPALNVPTARIPGHIVYSTTGAHQPICLVPAGNGTNGGGEQEANTILIAAAPELLDALDRLQASPNDPRAHRQALDAIAKATGGAL